MKDYRGHYAPAASTTRRRRHGARRHDPQGKRTAPPKPFNDASLIAAIPGVIKFVRDPAVKKLLTEADGIGTPATRAAIIETLFERGYVERVRARHRRRRRPAARSLPVCPTSRRHPTMTATWEAALRAITRTGRADVRCL